jgi:hypothetical protein
LLPLVLAWIPACAHGGGLIDDPNARLDRYDVVWPEPGHGPEDSMPLGNGDIGLNVWTEQNGDLLFYIGKTDAWSEEPSGSYGLMKLGRVRVSLSPHSYDGGKRFQQALRLSRAQIEVMEDGARLRVWVDANRPVIHVDLSSEQPVAMKVTLEDWRDQPRSKISADVLLAEVKDRLEWYHRDGSDGDSHEVGRTFGALIKGDGLIGEGTTLESAQPARVQHAAVYVLTKMAPRASDWLEAEAGLVRSADAVPEEDAWRQHQLWWSQFWLRSWIFLDGDASAEQVTQGYLLQRFVSAAAGRGAQAIKFNGSIFVVDNPSVSLGRDANKKDILGAVNADFRSWGGQYWFQNTRPIYWPMLAQGDFDSMQPLFRQYRSMLESNAALVKQYYHHEGAYFAETAPYWGGLSCWPPEKPGKYTDFYFTPILELSMMMLDYYAYTGDEIFARETLLPVATEGVTFFDRHFGRDAQGKLLLDPDNAIEMFWKVHDPAPDLAGLRAVLTRLLALPADLTAAEQRKQWSRLLTELPPLPVGAKNGKAVLLPYSGEQDQPSHNSENPELYAIYPFRLYGLGKPELQLARDTFDERAIKATGCWVQDPVQAAYLGMAALAKADVTFDLTRKDVRMKFPAFWDKGHDYAPDEDNGGNGELGLQLMLLQSEGARILLLPAWPAGWNADFKLHAPNRTTLEGRVEKGKLVRLKVTPESRRKDIEMMGDRDDEKKF